jgi:anti-sigma28 factor (negative regulator of flagellin synthesis)
MEELTPLNKILRKGPVAANSLGSTAREKSVGKSGVGSSDRVTLSPASKEIAGQSPTPVVSSDIRHDLVNKYRRILESGDYEVKAGEIAEKMVQKIRDDKDLPQQH